METMMRTDSSNRFLGLALLGLMIVLASACGGPADDAASTPDPVSEDTPTAQVQVANPPTAESTETLPVPFSAAQIQEAWLPGLVLVIDNTSPKGPNRQRWTVQTADESGATIEYAMLGADGTVIGEPVVQPTTWAEFEKHGEFPAAVSERREETRTTSLGELEGWVYTTTDSTTGMITEVFFANDMPGAPVSLVSSKDGVEIMTMHQIERYVP